MALNQAFEIRALVENPKLKEQNGVLLHAEADERRARELYDGVVGEMLAGTSPRYDMTRWLGVVLTGPNGAFERSMRIRIAENADAGPR